MSEPQRVRERTDSEDLQSLLSGLQLTAGPCMWGRKSLSAGERTTRKEQVEKFPEITQAWE